MKSDSVNSKDDDSKARSKKSLDEYKKKSAERLRKFREETFPPNYAPFAVQNLELDENGEPIEYDEEFDGEEMPPNIPNFPDMPPPPNMGFSPFPPHPFHQNMHPHFMENLEEHEGEFEDDFDEADMPPPFAPPPFVNFPPPHEMEQFFDGQYDDENFDIAEERKGVNLAGNYEIEKMQEEGGRRADAILVEEQITGKVSKTFGVLASLFMLGLLSAVCALSIYFIYDKTSVKGMETEKVIAAEEGEYLRSRNYWFLPESPANKVVKNFYMSMGDLEFVGNFEDISFRGFVNFKDRRESIYCIKRPNGSYIKLGMGDSARAYLVELNENGQINVYKLLDGNINGRREELEKFEAEKIRALSAYDDDLIVKAFPRDKIMRGESGFSLGEKEMLNGVECEIILLQELDGLNKKYCFSENHASLIALISEFGGKKIEIFFSRFIASDGGYRVPEVRQIFVDGELYAEVAADFIVRNRGAMFPR